MSESKRLPDARAERRSLAALALALALAVLVAHGRVVALGDTWDDVRYHTEVAPLARLAAAHAVARGEVPAWWEASGLGEPLLGEPSHAALDPPTWLARSPRALDVVMVLMLWWAALGVAAWARRAGASDLAALGAGLMVGASGVLASSALRGALPAVAQLPWVALGASALAAATDRGGKMRAAAGVAAAIGATALAGELAVMADAVLVAAVIAWPRRPFVATRVVGTEAAPDVPPGVPAQAIWLLAAIVAGLAIGAAQWIPAALAIPQAIGAHVSGLPLSRFLELVVPGSFGADDPGRAVPAVAGTSAWLPSLYVGVPLLALARPRGRTVVALLVLAVLALVAGRGGWPGWLGAPELHVAALVALLGAPAALGLDAALAGERRIVVALGVGIVALVSGLVALAVHGRDGGVDRALLDGGLSAVCIAGAGALAYFTRGKGPSSRARAVVVVALLVAPSVGALASTAPVVDRAIVDTPPLWAYAPRGPWPRRTVRPPYMVKGYESLDFSMRTLAGESAYWWGIGELRSQSIGRSPAIDRMFQASAHQGGDALVRYGAAFPILPESVTSTEGIPALTPPTDIWVIAHYPTVPPASLAYGWRWSVDEANAFDLLFPVNKDVKLPAGTIVLSGQGAATVDKHKPSACRVVRWDDGDIAVACSPTDAAYAVISSAPADGWSVTVDGEPQPWLTADVLKRAVAVSAGSHDVRWTYRAPGFVAGLVLSLLGLAAIGVLGWRGRRRRR